jgi:hypothetical protein
MQPMNQTFAMLGQEDFQTRLITVFDLQHQIGIDFPAV